MEGKQVALIRGINVGRAKRVSMADLRMVIEDIGCHDVRTILNSGNVVFVGPNVAGKAAALRIEEELSTRLSVSARVIVLTAAELLAIVNDNPLAAIADNYSRLLVAVLENPADRIRLKPLEEQDWTPEVLAIGVKAAYLWCPDGVLVSPLAKAVGRILGEATTTRNWATILKLYELTKI